MNADPLSYLFSILKYVSTHININNNINNNYNNNYIIKAFGPCIRAMLRKEEYTDIFLIISCRSIISEMIKLLRIFEVITFNIEMDYTKLIIFQINYKNKIYTIHIGTDIYKFNQNMNNKFGITCDNLEIDYEGNISTIITHHLVKGHNNITWVTSCIQDVMSGKFRVILLENVFDYEIGENYPINRGPFDKIIYHNEVCQNMVCLGFEFDRENSKNLTFYKFIELVSHTEIKKYDEEREISQSCCICREDYSEEPDKKTILIGCHHDFHIECLKKWVTTNKGSCPTCRTKLNFNVI
jgi:hypothetical protein